MWCGLGLEGINCVTSQIRLWNLCSHEDRIHIGGGRWGVVSLNETLEGKVVMFFILFRKQWISKSKKIFPSNITPLVKYKY